MTKQQDDGADARPCDALSPLEVQIGGNHYKGLAIQPVEYSMANSLDCCQYSVVKYVTRFRDKGGIRDLEKAMHFLQMLAEFEKAGARLSDCTLLAELRGFFGMDKETSILDILEKTVSHLKGSQDDVA